jgi:coenzyme F420-reducing hydrogenase beta subunit
MKVIPVLYENKENCCGCSACCAICPVTAITMEADEKGFLYPSIDSKLCIECGLCIKVCPIRNSDSKENSLEPDVYAAKHKSDEVRMNSSSGGMFTAISDYVIDSGGVVYGAAFDEDFKVCHICAVTKYERDQFRGSKYVQSDLDCCFQEIKEKLENGISVLFSGTPCQVEGLNKYLRGVEISQLMTVDNVCHGTPSPKIFTQYLDKIKSQYNSNIKWINFRYKLLGWRSQAINISLENGQEYISTASEDPFYRLFLPNIILRDSCYQCIFTNVHRPSDITLGDFWGIEESLPDFEDEKGVSLVLVNTEKGRKIFNNLTGVLDIRKSDLQSCLQPNLKGPSVASPKMEQFWIEYQKYGFEYALSKYGIMSNGKQIIKKILMHLGLFDEFKKIISFGDVYKR